MWKLWRHFSAVRSTCMALIRVPVSSHPLSVPSLYCGAGIKWRRIAEHRPVGSVAAAIYSTNDHNFCLPRPGQTIGRGEDRLVR